MAAAKTEPTQGSVALKVDGAEMTVPIGAKQFASGSRGYFWQGKVEGSDGRRYQTQVSLVLIGSKPK